MVRVRREMNKISIQHKRRNLIFDCFSRTRSGKLNDGADLLQNFLEVAWKLRDVGLNRVGRRGIV